MDNIFEEYCLDGTMNTEKYFNVLEIPLPGFTKDSKEEEKNALSTWISHFSKNFFWGVCTAINRAWSIRLQLRVGTRVLDYCTRVLEYCLQFLSKQHGRQAYSSTVLEYSQGAYSQFYTPPPVCFK